MMQSEIRRKFFEEASKVSSETLTRQQIKEISESAGISFPQWFTNDPNFKVSRGIFINPKNSEYSMKRTPKSVVQSESKETDVVENVVPMKERRMVQDNRVHSLETDIEVENLVPEVDSNYVPFGHFTLIRKIVNSNKFFPVFITGQSGNGKTMSVEQACAKEKRKFVIVSMTPDTDESDLLGNYVLVNGEMRWRDGPITTAAKQGAVLCIDEIDYGSQNLSSIQRVLEGKPFLLKKKGELVTPAKGFTVFATANTKGKGSDDGRYMFTNILNEAFLERFPVTLEQEWPSKSIEKKILNNLLPEDFVQDTTEFSGGDFVDILIEWADGIRKTFADGGVDEVISTRRLVHIIKTFLVIGNSRKSVELCLNRFDTETKNSFLDLYDKLCPKVVQPPSEAVKSEESNETQLNEDPF